MKIIAVPKAGKNLEIVHFNDELAAKNFFGASSTAIKEAIEKGTLLRGYYLDEDL